MRFAHSKMPGHFVILHFWPVGGFGGVLTPPGGVKPPLFGPKTGFWGPKTPFLGVLPQNGGGGDPPPFLSPRVLSKPKNPGYRRPEFQNRVVLALLCSGPFPVHFGVQNPLFGGFDPFLGPEPQKRAKKVNFCEKIRLFFHFFTQISGFWTKPENRENEGTRGVPPQNPILWPKPGILYLIYI